MKHVRQAIAHQLVDAMHQCNLADLNDTYDECNDINSKCSRQHEAYGHISNALTSLGFNKAVKVYCDLGSPCEAHDAIDAQYGGIDPAEYRGNDYGVDDLDVEEITMQGGAE